MKNPKEGATVDAIPATRRPTIRYNIDWDHMANLARLTGKPVLAGTNIRITQLGAIRQYKRPAFRDETGHIKAIMRESKINPEDGVRYGDIYFEWIDTTNQEEGN